MEVQEIIRFLKQFPEDMEMLIGCHSIYDGHAELCSFKRFDTTCIKQDGKHLCIYGYNDGARCTKKEDILICDRPPYENDVHYIAS